MSPLIGITSDTTEPVPGKPRAMVAFTYVRAVEAAGGVPIILPPVAAHAARHLALVDGLVLSGGDDVDTTKWGVPVHPRAKVMHPDRQAYELALLDAVAALPGKPVLGICLGMQLMGMHAGGALDQHLDDTRSDAARHRGDHHHGIAPEAGARAACERLGVRAGQGASSHHQALTNPGRLSVLARSDDGVIEAVADEARPFYLGVQWHPERTQEEAMGLDLFKRLVDAARRAHAPSR